MNELARPSPDALLKAARREARGRLKIFLGAAPGVGKTYEMLREGNDLLRAGQDVVVGVVETHGRAETLAMVAPFEVLTRRTVDHRTHQLDEFDLDAMLERKPAVALIDEFAHTNAPGSRHPKRWQDIEELRDAGIDVLTTLNIQHVESLNDVVAGFTRVRVRETVPDAMLDDAELKIVDVTPDELIARLKAGKIYLPEEASRALEHFFSRSNLSALRELTLRRAAQTVDRNLLDHVHIAGEAGTWAAGQRIVVAVGDQPGVDSLIRAAKRLADAFHAPWTAVCIETPRTATLGPEARTRIAGSLKLAGGLGAMIATVPARTVAEGLIAYIAETRSTAVVIGRTRRGLWFRLRHGSIVETLGRTVEGVAIHVLPTGDEAKPERGRRASPDPKTPGALAGLALVAVTTLLARLLLPVLGPNSVDLLYLLPVIATATLFGLRASLLASLAAALCYNFFFLEPVYTLTISDPQNVVTLIVLIVVSVVASRLAGGVRREATIGARSAGENAAIAIFGQRLAAASDEDSTAALICAEISQLLDVATVLLSRKQGRIELVGAHPPEPILGAIDMAAAEWTYDRGEVAGKDSGTLTASDWQFHPLQTSLGVLGVLGVAQFGRGDPLPADKRVLFTTLIGQAAMAHERLTLEARARDIEALQQRDDLRGTLLSSIGHDLKTPLTAMIAAADALAAEHGPSPEVAALKSDARRLRRVFDDLVEMTRIEAGAIVVRREATDLTDAVNAAAEDLRPELARHRLMLEVSPTLPLVEADPRLLHHVLINLLGNAAKYADADTDITVCAEQRGGSLELLVRDNGLGLPEGGEDALFEQFTRFHGDDRSGGTGLGLAIVKGFARAMGLGVAARNRPGGGAEFAVIWPGELVRPAAPLDDDGGDS